MSVIDTIKNVVGFDSGITTHQYRCVDCDNQFSSAKDPERASCMECMGHNVELIDDQ
jgi:Zn finger protein HypA/HybF involved in hydrogenase expression